MQLLECFYTFVLMKNFDQRIAFGVKLGLTSTQARMLARLKTPARIQDFINAIPANFEPDGDTCFSVCETLKHRRAHCIEAAFVAACALWINGDPPLLMDLRAKGDYDHVIALFRRRGCWGAISKSNHVWLRWRDPVYRTPRELAISYFHEYATGSRRTLTEYSLPFDLRRFAPSLWVANKEPCWTVGAALDDSRHIFLITPEQARNLRPSDAIERRADMVTEYRRPRKRFKRQAKKR